MTEKIPCTVGILTFNSGKNLGRALESVKDFDDILICDGGSVDDTLSIAEAFGARIIRQDPRFQDDRGALTDYAGVRNQCVDAATHDWFLYIDSDEVASRELVQAVRAVVTAPHPKHLVYWVRFCLTNPDLSVVYQKYKNYYQPRFFNRTTGARFERPIHERVVYDEKKYVPGRIEAPWYVPTTDEDFFFTQYLPGGSAWQRLTIQSSAWKPRGVLDTLNLLIATPVIETGKSLYKLVYVKLRYGRDGIPARYELLRICSHWIAALMRWRRAAGLLISRSKRATERVRAFRLLGKLVRGEAVFGILQGRDGWDTQFERGTWDFLLEDQPNTDAIAAYCAERAAELGRPISVCDIGCGNGGLLKALRARGCPLDRYTGIDLSEVALTQAEAEWEEGTYLLHDLQTGFPRLAQEYDIYVVSEVLYYLSAPRTFLKDLRAHMPAGSVAVFSIYRSWRGAWIRCLLGLERRRWSKTVRVRSHNGVALWRVVMISF